MYKSPTSFITPTLLADIPPIADLIGLTVGVIAVSFAFWQFRIQRDKAKNPDYYFRDESDRERKFLTRQASRRSQLSVLVGLFGVFMLAGMHLQAYGTYPRAWAVCWLIALIFLVWGGALAFVDVVSIRLHYSGELDRQRAEKLALDYKMKKFHEKSLQELNKARQEAEEEQNELENGRSQD